MTILFACRPVFLSLQLSRRAELERKIVLVFECCWLATPSYTSLLAETISISNNVGVPPTKSCFPVHPRKDMWKLSFFLLGVLNLIKLPCPRWTPFLNASSMPLDRPGLHQKPRRTCDGSRSQPLLVLLSSRARRQSTFRRPFVGRQLNVNVVESSATSKC